MPATQIRDTRENAEGERFEDENLYFSPGKELIEIKIPSREKLLCTSMNYSKVHEYIINAGIHGFYFCFYFTQIDIYVLLGRFQCSCLRFDGRS